MFLLAGIVYSLLYNDERWVREMDLEEHVFSAKNIPMLAAGMLVALYAVYIAVVIYRKALKGLFTQKSLHQNYTRRVPPFLGVFGIFGLLGLSRLLDMPCARHCLPISSLCPVWAVRAVF